MSNPVQGSVSQSRSPLPVSTVFINGEPLHESIVRKVVINEEVYKHQSAVIDITYASSNLENLKYQPIYFRYGSNPGFGHFWGYIKDASKAQPFQKDVNITITCLGYTWDMRTPNNRMWVNTSLQNVADDINFEHKMGTYFPDHWYRPRRVAQAQSTDWGMSVEVAKVADRVLVARRGVLRFVDVLDELEKGTALRVYNKSLDTLDPQDKGLLDFSASTSVLTDEDELSIRMGYFSSDGEVHVVSDPDRPDVEKKNLIGHYVNNEEDAKALSELVSDTKADTATARLRGDGTVCAASVIAVDTGSKRVGNTDSLDGLWFVTAVTQSIDEGTFQTHVSLIRDKYRRPTGKRYEYYDGDNRAQPELRLLNEKWVSSWA